MESKMKINFTKKQYDTLLELVQLGHSITAMNDDTAYESRFMELIQYVMSFAKDFGYDGVLYNQENQMFDVTDELEQQIQRTIDEYEDMVFWDKLVYYMARRDFEKEMAQNPIEEEAAFQRLIEIEEKYHEYFEKHGVEHVKIEK